MKRKYLAFDIETAKALPEHDQNWIAHRPLGISCAATLASDADSPSLWHGLTDDGLAADRMSREDVARLVEHLTKIANDGYSILTWNGLGFDFDILAEESGMIEECKTLALGHVDMMFHAFCVLGYGIGLDAAAKGMNLAGKTAGMSGALAPQLWANGNRQEVLDYVAQDVRTTLQLARAGEKTGALHWISQRGSLRDMILPDGWLPVSAALKLPKPDTSWMSNPWPRTKFTGWMRRF
jgi:hypothetical protein